MRAEAFAHCQKGSTSTVLLEFGSLHWVEFGPLYRPRNSSQVDPLQKVLSQWHNFPVMLSGSRRDAQLLYFPPTITNGSQ
jgi:hypothetical protein